MKDFPDFNRRWTRERVANLNDMRNTVESLSRMGTASFPGEELPNESPELLRCTARITGRSAPQDGQLFVYTYQVVNMTVPVNDVYLPIWKDYQYFYQALGQYPAYERSNNGSVPIDGTAMVELQLGPGASWLFDWDHEIKWAKLTAEGSVSQLGDTTPGEFEAGSDIPGVYSWDEYYATINGDYALRPGGLSGTLTQNFARELNGTTGLTGRIVRLWRSYSSGYGQVATALLQAGDGATQYTQQAVTIVNAASGTFTLTFFDLLGNQTLLGPIAFNVNASGLENAFSGLGFNVFVGGSGTVADPFIVTFADSGFSGYPLMDADSSGLQGDQEWTFTAGGVGSSQTSILVSDGGPPVAVTKLEFPTGTLSFPSAGVALYTPTAGDEHDINRWKESGQWYTANNSSGLTGVGFSPNSGYWYAIPVIVTGKRTITGLSFWNIGGGGGGALAEMALYNVASDSAILPSNPIATALAMDYSVGDQLIIGVINNQVSPGLYWLFLAFNTSMGAFGVPDIISVLPTDVSIAPVQLKWLKTAGGYPSGFPNNPFTLADGQSGTGPYLAWRF